MRCSAYNPLIYLHRCSFHSAQNKNIRLNHRCEPIHMFLLECLEEIDEPGAINGKVFLVISGGKYSPNRNIQNKNILAPVRKRFVLGSGTRISDLLRPLLTRGTQHASTRKGNSSTGSATPGWCSPRRTHPRDQHVFCFYMKEYPARQKKRCI